MPLSEHEQRVLEQLERDLGADPKLGRSMARGPRNRGRIALGVIGVIAGLGVVLIGVVAAIVPLGIVGFALMTAAAMWAIFAPTRPALSVVGKSKSSGRSQRAKQPFMRRVENRLERRREQGDL